MPNSEKNKYALGLFVIAIAFVLSLPFWLALLSYLKIFAKLLTPDVLAMSVKGGAVSNAKSRILNTSADIAVRSHKPWRKKVGLAKELMADAVLLVIGAYRSLPLLAQIAIAGATLFFTAGTGYMFLAILAIPQPVVLWLKSILLTLINKTGVGAIITKIAGYVIPDKLSWNIYMFFKWRVGRKRVLLSYRIYQLVNRT